MDPNLKAVLLSNRAACWLKSDPKACVEDCSDALAILKEDASLRCKLLYRRAKARFLLTEPGVVPNATPSSTASNATLQDAAKDLLSLLSIDPTNKPAGVLLKTIRAKHGLTKGTPVSQTLDALLAARNDQDDEKSVYQCKVLMGLLTNDAATAIELGQRGGVEKLLSIAPSTPKALQVLACASSNPKFIQTFGKAIPQSRLAQWIEDCPDTLGLSVVSVFLRLVLYLDPLDSLDETSQIDTVAVIRTATAALRQPELQQAGLDLLSSWTASDRESAVQTSVSATGNDTANLLAHKKSPSELRSMPPRAVANYKKEEYKRSLRDKRWAKERAQQFCASNGLDQLLETAVMCRNHSERKRIGVGLGRVLSAMEEEDDLKKATANALGPEGVTIEEIDEDKDETKTEAALDREHLLSGMKKVFLVSSMLLGQAESSSFAVARVKTELRHLIQSDDDHAMAVASELVSAAASVEKCRPVILSMLNDGSLEDLLVHPDNDIRSGAASAATKLGLADKMLASNEGEVMGLLQVAVELLDEAHSESDRLLQEARKIGNEQASIATTSVERGVEVLGYLSAKTQVKEEIAHGFKAPPSSETSALEQLVSIASRPGTGASLSAYSLASIFTSVAVSNETLRREAFAGKEITVEQYDELQRLGKTEEEKDASSAEQDVDPQNAVDERIRKLAAADVPQALVRLLDGASEKAAEKIMEGLSRMATELSVRGIFIQQGVLSACIQTEKKVSTTAAICAVIYLGCLYGIPMN